MNEKECLENQNQNKFRQKSEVKHLLNNKQKLVFTLSKTKEIKR